MAMSQQSVIVANEADSAIKMQPLKGSTYVDFSQPAGNFAAAREKHLRTSIARSVSSSVSSKFLFGEQDGVLSQTSSQCTVEMCLNMNQGSASTPTRRTAPDQTQVLTDLQHAARIGHLYRQKQKQQNAKRFSPSKIRPLLAKPDQPPTSRCQNQSDSEESETSNAVTTQPATLPIHSTRWDANPSRSHNTLADPLSFVTDESDVLSRTLAHVCARLLDPAMQIDAIFNVDSLSNRFAVQRMTHEDFRFCAIAHCKSAAHFHDNPSQPLPEEVILCFKRAMSNHRRRLAKLGGKADEIAIMTTLFFKMSALASGDKHSFQVHKRGIEAMINSMGGFEHMANGAVMKNGVLAWEPIWAMLDDNDYQAFANYKRTYVPYYPRYPFTARVSELVSILPTGFQKLAKRRRLAFDVLEVLGRIAKTTEIYEAKGTVIDQAETFDVRHRRYVNLSQACPCLLRPNYSDEKPDLEKLIVVGLILYCFVTFTEQGSISTRFKPMRQRLSSDLERAIRYSSEDEYVLLWLWMITIDSWKQPDGSLPVEGQNLLQQAHDWFPQVNCEFELQNCLKRFFWSKPFGDRCSWYWTADFTGD